MSSAAQCRDDVVFFRQVFDRPLGILTSDERSLVDSSCLTIQTKVRTGSLLWTTHRFSDWQDRDSAGPYGPSRPDLCWSVWKCNGTIELVNHRSSKSLRLYFFLGHPTVEVGNPTRATAPLRIWTAERPNTPFPEKCIVVQMTAPAWGPSPSLLPGPNQGCSPRAQRPRPVISIGQTGL